MCVCVCVCKKEENGDDEFVVIGFFFLGLICFVFFFKVEKEVCK